MRRTGRRTGEHDSTGALRSLSVSVSLSAREYDLHTRLGFDTSAGDNGADFVPPSITHIDCIHRHPEDMTRYAIEEPPFRVRP